MPVASRHRTSQRLLDQANFAKLLYTTPKGLNLDALPNRSQLSEVTVCSRLSADLKAQLCLTQADPLTAAPIQARIITKQLVALAASGAVLGPLCDGHHSRFGVLHYTSPSLIAVPSSDWHLETCWYCFALACLLCLTLCLNVLLLCNDVQLLVCYRWVPLLFAVAAVIIGTGHTVLDVVMIHWQVCAASRANLRRLLISNSTAFPACE